MTGLAALDDRQAVVYTVIIKGISAGPSANARRLIRREERPIAGVWRMLD